MSLPVSQYEALLAEVRGLRRKAQHVQELANPLISQKNLPFIPQKNVEINVKRASFMMDSPPNAHSCDLSSASNHEGAANNTKPNNLTSSDDECCAQSSHGSVNSEPVSYKTKEPSTLYHGTWPVEKTMWIPEPTPFKAYTPAQSQRARQETTSVMSFGSSSGCIPPDRILEGPNPSQSTSQQLEAKVDMVYSLLSMLSDQEHADMGETLLALSTNPESCFAMRESGCIPLLVQMIQLDKEIETRNKAAQTLHNLIVSIPDEKLRKREMKIYKLIEHIRSYIDVLRTDTELELRKTLPVEDDDTHPVQTVAHLMKLSFDESHRQSICHLGGIFTIASLIEAEHMRHFATSDDANCMLMRRYACMALTNLTFGDSNNKALLCSFREFMKALVAQLQSSSDDLRQVTASVLRNLSWRADSTTKEVLREVGSVAGLMRSAMLDNKENTLKSILSALWNLSAHCTENKSEICEVEGALAFLVSMLTYKTPSKSLAIIENSGGILRNISSQIAVRDDYREILREHNCLEILLDQLKSPSLTIVSNACGTLWNLSAKCPIDQEILWELGAPNMLRSLNHSKHKMIAMGSSAALRNLLSARPQQSLPPQLDTTAAGMDLPALPTLGARKQKALLQDLDQNLAETCDNIEKSSPIKLLKSDSSTSTYNNLDTSRPSTSSDCSTRRYSSLQFNPIEVGDISAEEQTKHSPKTFVKSATKNHNQSVTSRLSSNFYSNRNVAKTTKMASGDDSRIVLLDDSTCDNAALSNSIVVEKCRTKTKEGADNADEKDSCSLEDLCNDEELCVKVEEKVDEQQSGPSHCDSSKLVELRPSADCGVAERDKDEVDLDDVAICLGNDLTSPQAGENVIEISSDQEDCVEKQDNEKEKISNLEVIEECGLQTAVEQIQDSGATTSGSHVNEPTTGCGSGLQTTGDSCCNSRSIENNAEGSEETLQVRNIDKMEVNDPCHPITETETATIEIGNDTDLTVANSGLPAEELSTISKSDEEAEMLPDLCDHPEYTYLPPVVVNLDAINNKRDMLLQRSCEETIKLVDNRMLDPDAMIESLDRFTAELVSQASSHLQNKEDNNTYRIAGSTNDDTWNEGTSSNEVTFPSISNSPPNVITFGTSCSHNNSSSPEHPQEMVKVDVVDGDNGLCVEYPSNDFSSINTSTMTESTLIAIEAAKVVTAFKNEAAQTPGGSPVRQQRSLPSKLLLKRALSLTNGSSSLESLDNHSLSNLDKVNPPSQFEALDCMEGSMISVASLPSEHADVRADFVINGVVNRNNPMFGGSKHHGNGGDFSHMNSITDLENVNPPSFFNEITDLCNSLADIPTEAICSETEVFEDCQTHVVESTLQTGDEITEFSDANSITPIQSDLSSPEITPKRNKPLSVKQRRSAAKDRYRTYTIGAGACTKVDASSPAPDPITSCHEYDHKLDSVEYKSCFETSSEGTFLSPTYTVHQQSSSAPKMTPKERRLTNKSRFETRVIDVPTSEALKRQLSNETPSESSGTSSAQQSPAKEKLSVRQTFIRKRYKHKDRFKTQTLSTISPLLLSTSSEMFSSKDSADLHFLVQKEANLVLNTLNDVKLTSSDDLLECETLSLVSNDDDSEQNSGSFVNYRTYNRSWSFKKDNLPVIQPLGDDEVVSGIPAITQPETAKEEEEKFEGNGVEEVEPEQEVNVPKPKIMKPSSQPQPQPVEEVPSEGKGIRGRRKALYSKPSVGSKVAPKQLRAVKNITSTVVKDVTASFKSRSNNIPKPPVTTTATKPVRPVTTKPPISRGSSGYGSKPSSPMNTSPLNRGLSKNSLLPKQPPSSKTGTSPAASSPGLERQGTFTKDIEAKTKIPPAATTTSTKTPAGKVATANGRAGGALSKPTTPTRIPAAPRGGVGGGGSNLNNNGNHRTIPMRNALVKSASSDRAGRDTRTNYNRSASADSKDALTRRRLAAQNANSNSTQAINAQGETGAVKRSLIPRCAPKSTSNTNLNNAPLPPTAPPEPRKQVTSKIASIWKKIEESKKQPPKKDSRVWIQAQDRQGGDDTKDGGTDLGVPKSTSLNRISRQGSFIVVAESDG